VNEHILSKTSFGRLVPIGPGQPLAVGVGRRLTYVDDVIGFSTDPVQLNAYIPELHTAYAAANLCPNLPKLVMASTSAVALGLQFDGVRREFRPRTERLVEVIQATRFILKKRFLSGKGMQILISYWIWFALLFRPALSIFSSVFAFAEKFKLIKRPQLLWHSVRGELEAMCRIAPLLVANLAAPVFIKTNIYKISANARGTLLTTLPNRVQQRS